MKKFSNVFLSVATLLLAGQVVAQQQTQESCLPVSTVANTTFTRAIHDPNPQQSTIWALLSDNVSYQQKDWNVLFFAVLKDAKNPAEALVQGHSYFKEIALGEPTIEIFGNQVFCEYASVDDQYAVVSASPPLSLDNMMGLANKKFR